VSARGGSVATAAQRGAAFLALWLVLLPSLAPGDLAVGVIASGLATAASLALLPPQRGGVRFVPLLAGIPRFLWQSIVAGVDVARRALAPNLPLATGFVDYRSALPRGHARNAFATITSLMPGTLPCGEHADAIEFHCLDVEQPVVAQLAEEERRLAAALAPDAAHG